MASTKITLSIDVKPFRRALTALRWREMRRFRRQLLALGQIKKKPNPGVAERIRVMKLAILPPRPAPPRVARAL